MDVEEKADSEPLKKGFTVPLRDMMQRVKGEPPQKMLYSGIKENSIGFIFGPSKSGKTTLGENIALSIAAGLDEYLGRPINVDNHKVLFLSLEEFYAGRTNRNINQVDGKFPDWQKESWIDNFVVANEFIPRYISTEEDWKDIKMEIQKHNPCLTIIDSLSRLHDGPIEDSTIAKALMKHLREIAHDAKTTIAVLHHTPKLGNQPLTVHSMAGSRILAQEADFIIGLNKTADGKTYLKDVAFRYAPEDNENVTLLKLNEHQWFNVVGTADEAKLLSAFDGRRDDWNKLQILEFLQKRSSEGADVTTKDLMQHFVASGICSKETLYSRLKGLMDEGKVIRLAKGLYKAAA